MHRMQLMQRMRCIEGAPTLWLNLKCGAHDLRRGFHRTHVLQIGCPQNVVGLGVGGGYSVVLSNSLVLWYTLVLWNCCAGSGHNGLCREPFASLVAHAEELNVLSLLFFALLGCWLGCWLGCGLGCWLGCWLSWRWWGFEPRQLVGTPQHRGIHNMPCKVELPLKHMSKPPKCPC